MPTLQPSTPAQQQLLQSLRIHSSSDIMALSAKCLLVLSVIAVAAVAASAQSSCSGVPQGAKYRYILAYQAKDSSDAGKKALSAAVAKWMKEDCIKGMAVGQGLALPVTATTFG